MLLLKARYLFCTDISVTAINFKATIKLSQHININASTLMTKISLFLISFIKCYDQWFTWRWGFLLPVTAYILCILTSEHNHLHIRSYKYMYFGNIWTSHERQSKLRRIPLAKFTPPCIIFNPSKFQVGTFYNSFPAYKIFSLEMQSTGLLCKIYLLDYVRWSPLEPWCTIHTKHSLHQPTSKTEPQFSLHF